MNLDELYFKDNFTKEDNKTNLEINKLNVECITSNTNKFNLDENGNLRVQSISTIGAIPDIVSPIGAVHFSTTSTNPTEYYGGDWIERDNKFLTGGKELEETETTTGNNTLEFTAIKKNALNYTIEGKCSQETSIQGKNLFTGNKITNINTIGITGQFKNSVLKLNGTTTQNGMLLPSTNTYIELTPGEYVFSLNLLSGNYERGANNVGFYILDETDNYIGQASGITLEGIEYNHFMAFTLTETKKLFLRIYANNKNIAFNELELGIQIEKGTTKTSFEDFTPNSPTPFYPQEIKTIKGVRNLCAIEEIASYSLNGATFESNKNKIKIHGALTTDTQYPHARTMDLGFFKRGTYTFEKEITDGSIPNPIGSAFYIRNEENTQVARLNLSSTTYTTFTLETDTNLKLYLYMDGGTSFNNCSMTLKIEEGTKPSNYVPYGSWLKTKITGKNLLNLGKKTFTNIGIINTLNGSTWSISGTANASNYLSKNFINLGTFKAGTYTISTKNNNINNINIAIGLRNAKTKEFLFNNSANNKQESFTLEAETNLEINLWNNGIGNTYEGNIYIQIEKNPEATKYEKYQEKEILIDMNKKNLFNKETEPIVKSHLITETKLENGIRLYYNAENSEMAVTSAYKLVDITTLTQKEITLSIIMNANNRNKARAYIGTCDANGNNRTALGILDKSGKCTISLPINIAETNKYLCLGLYANTDGIVTKNDYADYTNIQIYEGKEPFYELCSINNTKDDFETVNGKLIKRIGKIILDGTENWAYTASTNTFWLNTITNYKKYAMCLSSHFKYNGTETLENHSIYIGQQALCITHNKYENVNDFKAFLKEEYDNKTPVTIYYELENPKIEDAAMTNIPLLEGKNHLTLDSNLETTTNILYTPNLIIHVWERVG